MPSNSKTTLKSLIDSILSTKGNIQKKLFNLAHILLGKSILYIGGIPHRILEGEFYLNSEKHPDPFTHNQQLQTLFGRWYFHKAGPSSTAKYRGGTYKGLDITLSTDSTATFALLIRSLEPLVSSKESNLDKIDKKDKRNIIEGPSLCVDYILNLTKNKSINDLVKQLDSELWAFLPKDWRKDKDTCYVLGLELNSSHVSLLPTKLVESPRIGLSLNSKKPSNLQYGMSFIMRPYRFLLESKEIKKGKPHIILKAYDRLKLEEISELTGVAKSTLQKYICWMETGKKMNLIEGIDNDQDCPTKWTHEVYQKYSGSLNSKSFCELYGLCLLLEAKTHYKTH
ncbi:hypothetical protein K7432_014628 [Basidiobolus ranarum]|uniref:LAGLIDADG homing endonuclease n=1 Tax=Basidiobolus ranarum TaxID=34480 RepID=A0ABR2WHC5_9FUNG